MGILNITPDSFYPGSRTTEEEQIAERLHKMVNEGADIIDIGAYSSRPNADDISPDEEMKRLSKGLDIIRKLYPDARVSVDTFRADIAARCVREYGVQMINDISGGELDSQMFETIAELKVAYILMHMKGTPQTMMQQIRYEHITISQHVSPDSKASVSTISLSIRDSDSANRSTTTTCS